jgi:hypothetical protein
MDSLYKKLQEKNNSRRNSEEKHSKQNTDDEEKLNSGRNDNERKRERKSSPRNKVSSASKSRQSFNNISFNMNNLSYADILSDTFEDSRYKGKQFNVGRYSAKNKKDILDNTEFGKTLRKKLAADEKKRKDNELLLSFKEKDVEVKPKFKCGKYVDPISKSFYSDTKMKKNSRSKSANDMYNSLKLSLLEKKEPLKPFICSKTKPKEKIEYFSPLSVSARDIKQSLSNSKLNLRNLQLLNALDLANKKPISDKPMKFGKYKDDLAKSLYTDRSFNKKSIKDIKASKEFQEFLKKEQKLKDTPKVAFKVGKVLTEKPPAYFSPVQRKTISDIHKEISRSGRNSANASFMTQSRK